MYGLDEPSRAIRFAALSVDEAVGAVPFASLERRWPSVRHLWMPARSIHALRVQIVPSRMLIDCRDGTIKKWWDGTHGRVLKGAHGLSRTNGSHNFIGELMNFL